MNEIQLHTVPWQHAILDDFLTGNSLDDLLEFWNTVPKNSRWESTVFRQAFDKEGNFIDLWFTQFYQRSQRCDGARTYKKNIRRSKFKSSECGNTLRRTTR